MCDSQRRECGERRDPSEDEAAAAGKGENTAVERAVTVAAGALGLAGYLYALGGVVVWLRIQTSQLAPDGAIIGANDRHLLAVGARVIAFELLLVLVVSVIVTGLFSLAIVRKGSLPPHSSGERMTLEKAWCQLPVLGSTAALELSLLLIAVGLSIQGPPSLRRAVWIVGLGLGVVATSTMIGNVRASDEEPEDGAWRTLIGELGEAFGLAGLRTAAGLLFAGALGAAIFALPLLQGTILLAGTVMIYTGHLVSWPRRDTPATLPAELVKSTGVWSAVALATVIALAWVATPPVEFTRAVVESQDGSSAREGAYLDRGDGGIYLGLCRQRHAPGGGLPVSDDAHIRLLNADESARLELGREQYVFDPGGRPSLWQVIKAGIGGGNAATHDAPLHHPLHGRHDVLCGGD